jgi:hypothetical protein
MFGVKLSVVQTRQDNSMTAQTTAIAHSSQNTGIIPSLYGTYYIT